MTQNDVRTSRRKARRRAATTALNNDGPTAKIVASPAGPTVLDEAAVTALTQPSEKRQIKVPLKSLNRTIYVSSEARARSLRASDEAIVATAR